MKWIEMKWTEPNEPNEPNHEILRGVFQNRGVAGKRFLISPPPSTFFFCSRFNFHVITQLETLATPANSLRPPPHFRCRFRFLNLHPNSILNNLEVEGPWLFSTCLGTDVGTYLLGRQQCVRLEGVCSNFKTSSRFTIRAVAVQHTH